MTLHFWLISASLCLPGLLQQTESKLLTLTDSSLNNDYKLKKQKQHLTQRRSHLPASAMALSSLGSLGLRCNFRLDMEEDLPKLKKDRQLPTGDFLDLIGGLFLKMKMEGGAKQAENISIVGHAARSVTFSAVLVSAVYFHL